MNAPQPTKAAYQRLDEIATPILVLDRGIMERNISAFEQRARELGVKVRPHGKTPKSQPIFRRLTRDDGMLATSTLAETEAAAEAGIGDIFYAVPLDHRKVKRAGFLVRQGVRLSFLADTLEAAELCARAAARDGVNLRFWIEIDVDHYRTGVDPAGGEFRALARFLTDHPSTSLRGLMSYAGASYSADGPEAIARLAEAHTLALADAVRALAADGIDGLEISFGSGPAVLHAKSLEGVTEVRGGIHVFQDLFQAGIGACGIGDIAVSVLASVISVRRDLNRVVIDAGGLALSKDRSTANRDFDAGYGLVCDVAGRPLDGVYVATVSQELGLLATRDGSPLPFDKLAAGMQVRILPNHADMTAAAYEGYAVVDGDDRVIDFWERANFW